MDSHFTPRQIVEELDKYIIGQEDAKKMVAIALRNRYRAKQLPEEMREEYVPKNILLIGPTGVGKTELARRLAKLRKAPFIKVEATKYTEVGYVGRNVEQMIRDLVAVSIRMLKTDMMEQQQDKALELANERLLDILWPKKKKEETTDNPMNLLFGMGKEEEKKDEPQEDGMSDKRKEFFEKLKAGAFDEREVEIEVENQSKAIGILSPNGFNDGSSEKISDMLGSLLPKNKKKRKTTVAKAREIFKEEEAQKLVDTDVLNEQAIELAEQEGIVFIDEFDKIAMKRENMSGGDVSREGVQRDILPIVEGCTVNTKYGSVKTDHILFIAAGAFHVSKPSDLIPELQGRFPIRVELNSLSKEDFKAILTRPEQALIKQYYMLLKADNVTIHFQEDAIDEIAEFAYRVNNETEDIGARRLHTILEKLLQDISFNAPPESPVDVTITAAMVRDRLGAIVSDVDVSQYIL